VKGHRGVKGNEVADCRAKEEVKMGWRERHLGDWGAAFHRHSLGRLNAINDSLNKKKDGLENEQTRNRNASRYQTDTPHTPQGASTHEMVHELKATTSMALGDREPWCVCVTDVQPERSASPKLPVGRGWDWKISGFVSRRGKKLHLYRLWESFSGTSNKEVTFRQTNQSSWSDFPGLGTELRLGYTAEKLYYV